MLAFTGPALYGQLSCSGGLSVKVEGAELPMQVDYIKSDLYCSNMQEGYIKILPIGGTPPYSYMWQDGNQDQEREDLAAGTYSITIQDSRECIDTMIVDILSMEPGSGQLLTLADQYGCGGCYLQDRQSTFFFQDVDYMARVIDWPDGNDLGQVDVCVDVYPKSLKFDDRMLMKRFWAVKTSKNEARLFFYFKVKEFDELAQDAGYKAFTEIIDTADINLTVFKGGLSTYDNYDYVSRIPREDLRIVNSNITDDVWLISFFYDDFEPNAYTGFYLDIADLVTTSVEEVVPTVLDSTEFYLLKNPVIDEVELTNDDFDKYVDGTIQIVDIAGHVLHQEEFSNDNLKSKKIPVKNWPPGAYIYVVEIPELDRRFGLKFIKI